MDEATGVLPGLPAIAGKPVHVAFDGERLTWDAGILLPSAVEQRMQHQLAEMIRKTAVLRPRP